MEKYLDYLVLKIGEERAKDIASRTFMTLGGIPLYPALKRAVMDLQSQYDIGIVIAGKGLLLGYQFYENGFPLKVVDQKRRGNGATWNPIDKLKKRELKGKKVLLIDNDVVTGRTTSRAVKEVSKYEPEFMDLLLAFERVPLFVRDYQYLHKLGIAPSINELFPKKDIKRFEITHSGIKVICEEYGGGVTDNFFLENDRYLCVVNTRKRAPKEIRKVITLERDFLT
jgi:hypothetical protein